MQRPDVEKYEALAAMGRISISLSGGEWGGCVEWPVKRFDPRTAVPELCAYVKHLEKRLDELTDRHVAYMTAWDKKMDDTKAILRDWLTACPETCGQCEDVRARAEEAGK